MVSGLEHLLEDARQQLTASTGGGTTTSSSRAYVPISGASFKGPGASNAASARALSEQQHAHFEQELRNQLEPLHQAAADGNLAVRRLESLLQQACEQLQQ